MELVQNEQGIHADRLCSLAKKALRIKYVDLNSIQVD